MDRWRHSRYYSILLPLLEYDFNHSWVTVGDGRYGTDANALINLGVKKVHYSDISDKLLRIVNNKGFIKEF